jgi:hypothetical protein
MTARKNGDRPTKELREFKFLIQPVLLLYDGENVPREVPAEPKTLTGLAELRAFADAFPAELASINADLARETIGSV